MSENIGFDLARAYERRDLIGWKETIEPGTAAREFERLRGSFTEFEITDRTRANAKMFLHWIVFEAFGGKIPNYYPQQIGDCVSFGAKHGTEITSAIDIYLKGMREKWRPVFPSYYYGTGRVWSGHSGGYSDGSSGSWMADAVMKYGTLFSDEQGCPEYSGRLAKEWGANDRQISVWKPKAIEYLIKAAAQINSWDDLVSAVNNGYPCPTASDVGYSMEAGSDGFHRQSTSWSHQMCFIGVDPGYKNGEEPYALILNNWGDCHGHLKDFDPAEGLPADLPVGVLRVRRKDAEKHIRAGETYAYSQFHGFPEQPLDKAIFMML